MAETLTQSKRFGVHVPANPVPTVHDFDYGSIPDAGCFTRANSTNSSLVTVASSQLQISHAATTGYNSCDTLGTYNLTGLNTYVQVADAGNQSITSHQAIFGIYKDSSNKLFLTALGNTLQCYKTVAGVQTQVGGTIAYNSTTHKWWRIRESGGTCFVDTSADGQAWVNQYSVANPFAITSVYVYCQSGCYQNESLGSYTYFDKLNLPLSATDLSNFISNSGVNPSIILIYQHWGETTGQQDFMQGWMDAIISAGAIPMVTWEPWVGQAGPTQSNYQLIDIINGNYDTYITNFATAAAAWGKQFYLRLAHEMNGNWYPWGETVNGNSAGQYITMWQHVYNIVHPICPNAIWVWSPNINFSGSPVLSDLYPGDSYVDWVGIDGYNFGTDNSSSWTTFTNVMSSTYNDCVAITSKPIMIAETGCSENGGTKSSWISSMFNTELATFPRIQTVVWFNESTNADFRIETSAASQEAFKQGIKNWMTKGRIGGQNIKVGNGMSRSGR